MIFVRLNRDHSSSFQHCLNIHPGRWLWRRCWCKSCSRGFTKVDQLTDVHGAELTFKNIFYDIRKVASYSLHAETLKGAERAAYFLHLGNYLIHGGVICDEVFQSFYNSYAQVTSSTCSLFSSSRET